MATKTKSTNEATEAVDSVEKKEKTYTEAEMSEIVSEAVKNALKAYENRSAQA